MELQSALTAGDSSYDIIDSVRHYQGLEIDMNPSHLREFAMRDRASVQDAKTAYWAERFREQGWEANWHTAQELAAYARRVRPDFPTARDRDEDLAHHVKLKELLDRAAHAFSRR